MFNGEIWKLSINYSCYLFLSGALKEDKNRFVFFCQIWKKEASTVVLQYGVRLLYNCWSRIDGESGRRFR